MCNSLVRSNYGTASVTTSAPKSTRLVNPVSGGRGSTSSTDDIELGFGENTPLLVGLKGRRASCQSIGSSVNMGILALAILLFGGIIIGTYLLIRQDAEWPISHAFALIERQTWGVYDAPTGDILDHTLVNNVLVLHTGGQQCSDVNSCIDIINELQYESILRANMDIPYNFLIGGDGMTYEGRGWKIQHGFDTLPKKESALVIGFIGNFTNENPSDLQLAEMKAFITESIRRFKLAAAHKIIGICNTAEALNDGEALFSSLSVWKNWFRLIKI